MVNNPQLLLSIINTKLRDNYLSLSDLCEDLDLDISEVVEKLGSIGYIYSKENNQFIRR